MEAVWVEKNTNRSVYRILHGRVQEASINIIVWYNALTFVMKLVSNVVYDEM